MWEVFSPRVRTLEIRAWYIARYRNEVNVTECCLMGNRKFGTINHKGWYFDIYVNNVIVIEFIFWVWCFVWNVQAMRSCARKKTPTFRRADLRIVGIQRVFAIFTYLSAQFDERTHTSWRAETVGLPNWMNNCLTTPQLKMKIGYWVSDKWYQQSVLEKKVFKWYIYTIIIVYIMLLKIKTVDTGYSCMSWQNLSLY